MALYIAKSMEEFADMFSEMAKREWEGSRKERKVTVRNDKISTARAYDNCADIIRNSVIDPDSCKVEITKSGLEDIHFSSVDLVDKK